jgi:hypothetical protein
MVELHYTPNNYENVTARITMDIYHEKQQSNWCAIHATNSLLQSPTYIFEDFKAIAESLDEKEMALMESVGDFH